MSCVNHAREHVALTREHPLTARRKGVGAREYVLASIKFKSSGTVHNRLINVIHKHYEKLLLDSKLTISLRKWLNMLIKTCLKSKLIIAAFYKSIVTKLEAVVLSLCIVISS